MERIIIIGCGGAGKSTLAQQLGGITGLPVIHLDKLFWHPGWVESTKDEIDGKIMDAMAEPRWIIDGNYNRTLRKRLEYCDTVIYLDFSRFACLMGVAKRVLTTYGTVRPDMAEGCPERFDLEFLQWVWNFNKTKRDRYYRLLNETDGIEKIVLKNRRAVKEFIKRVERGEYCG